MAIDCRLQFYYACGCENNVLWMQKIYLRRQHLGMYEEFHNDGNVL